MNEVEPILICQWPMQPVLPPPSCAVLLRVATRQPRQAARHKLREVLRQVLSTWSNLPKAELPLEETLLGPLWRGEIHGETLDISLSYGMDESWLGLIRGGRIGVDVAAVSLFTEVDDVARNYLGPSAATDIRRATNPGLAFTVAWTEREARLKFLKRGLTEWTALQTEGETQCFCRNLVLSDSLVGAVCWSC